MSAGAVNKGDLGMLKEVLASAELALGPTAALVIFFIFMVLVGFWIYRPGSAQRYAGIGASALDDDGAAATKRGRA